MRRLASQMDGTAKQDRTRGEDRVHDEEMRSKSRKKQMDLSGFLRRDRLKTLRFARCESSPSGASKAKSRCFTGLAAPNPRMVLCFFCSAKRARQALSFWQRARTDHKQEAD